MMAFAWVTDGPVKVPYQEHFFKQNFLIWPQILSALATARLQSRQVPKIFSAGIVSILMCIHSRFLSLSLDWTLFMRPFHLVCAYSTTPWNFLLSGFSNFLYLGILPGCLLFTGEWEVDVPVLKDCFNGAHFCTKTAIVSYTALLFKIIYL